jgi:hypothetical protein
MSKVYTIQEDTLKGIADAIRSKFNFNDEIPTTQFPMYISSGDAKQFWFTHFNSNAPIEGSGAIFTKEGQLVKRGWHDYLVFSPIADIHNAYKLTNRLDWREAGDAASITFTNIDFSNNTMTNGMATVKIPAF